LLAMDYTELICAWRMFYSTNQPQRTVTQSLFAPAVAISLTLQEL
jgi:hypothetical protein